MRWIETKAAATPDPKRAAAALERIAQNWPADALALRDVIESLPLGEAALLHLLAVSTISAERLAQHPRWLLWLRDAKVSADRRSRWRMLRDLRAGINESLAAQNFRALRLWKGREMTRIALREVAGAAPLEETTAELSQIATICLDEVFTHWNAELRARWGAPDAEFAVLGLGKLGGYELNHSSDVDLIFIYSEEGQLTERFSYHEWFNRLATKITETFAANDPAAGQLFRIDLRLRPEGSSGPLARSLDSMEHYYAGFGETWERLALMKARGVCGSGELAYEFLRRHQPFKIGRAHV